VQQVHKHMIAELARGGAHVDEWLFCPYHPEGTVEAFARFSADRKPAPAWRWPPREALGLDLSSLGCGDSDADIGLAQRSAPGRCGWRSGRFGPGNQSSRFPTWPPP
jgi:histidinol phosphatase-like enzyme